VAELDDETKLAGIRIPLIRPAASVRRRVDARGPGVAVTLGAALGAARAGKGLALFVGSDGPRFTSAGAEVVAVGDAVDEGHVVPLVELIYVGKELVREQKRGVGNLPDVVGADAVLELHRLWLAFLVDLENAVASTAVGQSVVP
jgi:hypothetical protein